MRVISPSFEIVKMGSWEELTAQIERVARTCYKSEDKIGLGSANRMVEMLIQRGHEAMLEHASFSVKFVCDRGVSHEIVRHRVASFAQESTRYCNYGNDKFDHQITLIVPDWFEYIPSYYQDYIDGKNEKASLFIAPAEKAWIQQMLSAEASYLDLLNRGWTPQQARAVLPNSLKTEVWMTANIREWRHFLKLRAAKAAHPQMRELAVPLLHLLQEETNFFDDIKED